MGDLSIKFSKEDTQQAKGVALLLLLYHHLFLVKTDNYGGLYIFDNEVVNLIAVFAKVCVGLFVLLSGYGLYKSQENKKVGVKSFYIRHYLKLYETYWFIWLIFVPISVFVFGRTFSTVYPDNSLLHMLFNLFGLQYLLIDFGYNTTWWFMTCIMILYFIYPFLKVLIDRFDYLILMSIFIISFFAINISFFGMQPYAPIKEYLLTFVLGIFIAKKDWFVKIKQVRIKKTYKIFVLFLLLSFFTWLRFQFHKKALILTDGIISYLIIQIMFLFNRKSKVLILLGKHSFNIFLFHTFIYYYFFKDFIYSFYYPILIFVVLTLICLGVSVGIDYIKKVIKWEKPFNRMKNVEIKSDIYF